jgi:hypothetical protein
MRITVLYSIFVQCAGHLPGESPQQLLDKLYFIPTVLYCTVLVVLVSSCLAIFRTSCRTTRSTIPLQDLHFVPADEGNTPGASSSAAPPADEGNTPGASSSAAPPAHDRAGRRSLRSEEGSGRSSRPRLHEDSLSEPGPGAPFDCNYHGAAVYAAAKNAFLAEGPKWRKDFSPLRDMFERVLFVCTDVVPL